MPEDFEKKRQKQAAWMRSMMDYVRGLFFAGLGVVFLFHEKLRIPTNERIPDGAVNALGVVFVLYGAWRIYKAIKKNYLQ